MGEALGHPADHRQRDHIAVAVVVIADRRRGVLQDEAMHECKGGNVNFRVTMSLIFISFLKMGCANTDPPIKLKIVDGDTKEPLKNPLLVEDDRDGTFNIFSPGSHSKDVLYYGSKDGVITTHPLPAGKIIDFVIQEDGYV